MEYDRYNIMTEVLDMEPNRETIEAAIFDDFLRLRHKGYSLKSLVLMDLEVHEELCSLIMGPSSCTDGG